MNQVRAQRPFHQKSRYLTQDKFKPNEKLKDGTTSTTHSPIRPSRHYVVRLIFPKDSANNVSFLFLMIPIPRLCSFIYMLGNMRLLDLVHGRRHYRGGRQRIGMGNGEGGWTGRKPSLFWRFASLRSRQPLMAYGMRGSGYDAHGQGSIKQRHTCFESHPIRRSPFKLKVPSAAILLHHRHSISSCIPYQCISSRTVNHPLI
jgi:hypothetical protein